MFFNSVTQLNINYDKGLMYLMVIMEISLHNLNNHVRELSAHVRVILRTLSITGNVSEFEGRLVFDGKAESFFIYSEIPFLSS